MTYNWIQLETISLQPGACRISTDPTVEAFYGRVRGQFARQVVWHDELWKTSWLGQILHKWGARIPKQAPGFSAAELKREKIFVWYDYLSCPQLLHDIELDEFGIQRGRFLDDSMNCEEGPLCVELIRSWCWDKYGMFPFGNCKVNIAGFPSGFPWFSFFVLDWRKKNHILP